ncbi:MAG: hypothetical protein FJ008_06950 [Chloroflexi bacterium]|nr:hypothetical protein [Chloroflexota bacterium]MBM3155059.1 hypothetical protein [Chloroflexota bacterium]MBM3173481.1 hypothetical protein [Chloroflexota bacterium]MBM3174233.1 hypothetical protein [Chloroflexota bacterium]MBM4451010.1 hypothetical protein [Chloroflexota bacterium]
MYRDYPIIIDRTPLVADILAGVDSVPTRWDGKLCTLYEWLCQTPAYIEARTICTAPLGQMLYYPGQRKDPEDDDVMELLCMGFHFVMRIFKSPHLAEQGELTDDWLVGINDDGTRAVVAYNGEPDE